LLVSSGTWRGPGWRLFDADPACGKAVRDWLSCVVDAHPCLVDTADAALVASELFGNAVMHGPEGGRVLVAYILWPHGARLVVCDAGGAGHPQVRDVDALTEGGRGLQVVEALSARWGTFRAARAQVVWCDLGQPLPAHAVEAWAWLSALLASTTLARAHGPCTSASRPTLANGGHHG
jgi:anti-sigma regulatory factor (Ser/Thr protein kinase)